jgi:hypothetical protein
MFVLDAPVGLARFMPRGEVWPATTAPLRVVISARGCAHDSPLLPLPERYNDWWSKSRRPGTVLRYGQCVQLAHAGTGELLAAQLVRSSDSGHGLYELALDTSMPDPYLEGRWAV